jgi:hypothetical protein
MKKFFESHLVTVIQIIYILIFGSIFILSLSYIINLWTYSEIHINYSQGFIRRGFLGQIITILTDLGLPKKKFFSLLFFTFSIINSFIFLKIINNKIKSIWIIIFFSFNPALIIFTFFDLGGYARFEIFGIFLVLIHTYLFIKTKNDQISIITYNKIYFYFLIPSIVISILIHEINLLIIFFHLITTYNIIKLKNINSRSSLIKYFSFLVTLVPISLFFLSTTIPEHKILQMYENLPDKENINLWIWKSIFQNLSQRNSEFLYMTNPIGNAFYYFLIFAFYLVPIIFIFIKNINFDMYKIATNVLWAIPLFSLFYIGRDWGRWIHLIIIIFFCYNMQFIDKKIHFSIKSSTNLVFIFLIIFQILFTRIPHCCNLIEKKINIIGGAIPKIIMLEKIFFNKINIKSRFNNF